MIGKVKSKRKPTSRNLTKKMKKRNERKRRRKEGMEERAKSMKKNEKVVQVGQMNVGLDCSGQAVVGLDKMKWAW